MLSSLQNTWDLLRSTRLATRSVASVHGHGFLELSVHRKKDGHCWVTPVVKSANATLFVPFEPDLALEFAATIAEVVETAKANSTADRH